ncbi:3-oxo-tetronate kinase [Salinisphaera sp.]|uniref:3-oxo-tetronate kinase n=1 Tax=Salinisphaera sp. TaxID=1914330 RepID=UPI002D77A119|nr:3-oxo-tetronate kinase [Salinisphaera sp.]HET7314109.1 3-oxo-tetronate kinase [Salinisphaera sp.]
MPLLGCIADDSTGATDLASHLVTGGMRTIQTIGVPEGQSDNYRDVDALVVALKSRTCPVDEAVESSLLALEWLQTQGCKRFYFKYCSTFDSTAEGNIGPVCEALMTALDTSFTIACPALPANHRTVYHGYLFVDGVLLNESGMQDHPLTPMTDANLLRVLDAQTRQNVGLIDKACIIEGRTAVRQRIASLREDGIDLAICDTIEEADLRVLAAATADLPLVTAGSGLAAGIAEAFAREHAPAGIAEPTIAAAGHAAIISGSCSRATRVQVEHARQHYANFRVDALALADDYQRVIDEALAQADSQLTQGPLLIYASADPETVREAQHLLGVAESGALVERALADIAARLVDEHGVRRLLVAGGETSGAVVAKLGVQALRIGAPIDPGVPWTLTIGTAEPLAMALKSGNFGATDFMIKAWDLLA